MNRDVANQRLTTTAAIFACLAVFIGGFALGTNYWTIGKFYDLTTNQRKFMDDQMRTIRWHGLIESCVNKAEECTLQWMFPTFAIFAVGLYILLIGFICSILDTQRVTNRRLVTPILIFFAGVFLTAGLAEYGSVNLLNSHSSRSMIIAVILSYIASTLSAYAAGRHSVMIEDVHVKASIKLSDHQQQ